MPVLDNDSKHVACVFYLLLQPNAETDDSITPLLSAVAAGSLPCIELLLKVLDFLPTNM